MRPRGLPSWNEETSCLAVRIASDEARSGTAVLLQEVMATQQATADDLHGFGCSLFCAGSS